MIIKIFKQSKPINLVIASLLVFFGVIASLFSQQFPWGLQTILGFITAIISILLVDFICKKNNLSQQSSYPILIFAILFNLYWISTNDLSILFANFFILLAFRRIISLKTNKDTIQKIFDAGFWIAVATLFSFWSILFYALLFIGITMYASENYKHYIIPIISAITLFTIVNSYHLFAYHKLFEFKNTQILFQYSNALNTKNIAVLGLIIVLFIGTLSFIAPSINQLSKKNKSSYLLIGFAFIISLIIFILNPKIKMLLFAYFPLAIYISVITENAPKKWIPYVFIYTPFIYVTFLYFI